MIQPIYEFVPPALAVKEIWCAKCKKYRPRDTSVKFTDSYGRRKDACVTCKPYVKSGPRI